MIKSKSNYTETINGVSFQMNFVEGGEVFIGEGENKQRVAVPDFHIAETPVTQVLWRAVMGEDPKELALKGDQRPVERVSWLDIVEGTEETNNKSFLKELNKKADFDVYKLPSEAMWQYAAQGGRKSEGYIYSGSNNLKEVGWFDTNSHSETKLVKGKQPNELGLYDMSGNVWEWCGDDWDSNLDGIPKDGSPRKIDDEKRRVVRGGSWNDRDNYCRVAFRYWDNADLRSNAVGFRLARY